MNEVKASIPFVGASSALPYSTDGSIAPAVLSPDQISQWREQGYVLANNILEPEVLNRIREVAVREYPDNSTTDKIIADFGSGDAKSNFQFPSVKAGFEAINELPLNVRMITAAGQLLGCDGCDLRLAQSDLWGKVGAEATTVFGDMENFNQRMHCDYPNHYLTFPTDWYAPDAVAMIVYLDDSEITGGETSLVPRQGKEDPAYHSAATGISATNLPMLLNPGSRGDLPWINNQAAAEKYLLEHHPEIHAFRKEHLYDREVKGSFTRGTVLFYRLDIWHRGTPVKPKMTRRVHNLMYKRAGCDFINSWNAGCAKDMYTRTQVVEKLIAHSLNLQRSVLGFPKPGAAYWTPTTLDAVKQRYGPLGLLHMDEIEEKMNK